MTARRTRTASPGGTKPKRQLSAAELAQRRAAQPAASAAGRLAATGPVTDEGKAIASRNAYVHGRYSAIQKKSFQLGAASLSKMFGKPCRTTCPLHPDNPDRTEAPCSLVVDQLTHAGGDCLDKTVYVHAFDALLSAMKDGDMDKMHGHFASEHAANFELLSRLRTEIAEHGLVREIPMQDKEGKLVYDRDGNMVPGKIIGNPAIQPYIALLETMKFSLPEMLATPKARKDMKTEEENAGSLQQFMASIMQRANGGVPTRRIERDA